MSGFAFMLFLLARLFRECLILLKRNGPFRERNNLKKSNMKDKSVIPHGHYCYSILEEPNESNNWKLKIKTRPYWSLREDKEEGDNGYCSFLESGDWESPSGGLLWDQVKECGINTRENPQSPSGWRREFIHGNGVDRELWVSPEGLCFDDFPDIYYNKNMSIHDETWDKCETCGETLKTFNSHKHGPEKCKEKELKSLEEVNSERLSALSNEYKTGIKCPECAIKRELIFENPRAIILSDPPKREVRCIFCGYSNYILY